MALQLIHFLKVILEDGDEGTDSYLFELFQLLDDLILLAYLYSYCSEEVPHVLVAKCTPVNPN